MQSHQTRTCLIMWRDQSTQLKANKIVDEFKGRCNVQTGKGSEGAYMEQSPGGQLHSRVDYPAGSTIKHAVSPTDVHPPRSITVIVHNRAAR